MQLKRTTDAANTDSVLMNGMNCYSKFTTKTNYIMSTPMQMCPTISKNITPVFVIKLTACRTIWDGWLIYYRIVR